MNTKNQNPFDDEITIDKNQIVAQPDSEPVIWSDFARANLLAGDPITAEELVNTTFDILRARLFESSFEGQDHAWYCIIRKLDDPTIYAVTLGGEAVVEILDLYASSGSTRPLRVSLDFTKGGKYGGYYSFK